MESQLPKMEKNPPLKTQRIFLLSQVLLRSLAFGATMAAALLMATNQQSAIVFGFPMDAKYKYMDAFRVMVIANALACAYALLSVPFLFIFNSKGCRMNSFIFFLFDMTVMGLLAGSSSAAAAIGILGRNGNTHAGWTQICKYFGKFCDRATYSIICSFASMLLFFFLTILSATKPRPVTVSSAS